MLASMLFPLCTRAHTIYHVCFRILFATFLLTLLCLTFSLMFVPELYALSRYMSSGRLPGNPESNGFIEDKETENNNESSKTDESELRLAQLQHQLPTNEPGALMHLVEESTADDTEEESVKECRTLFKDLKFYLSREVLK